MNARRRWTAGAGMLALVLALASGPSAAPGGTDDPRDTSGRLDIRSVGHTNTDSTITYRVEMYDHFRLEDIFLVRWDFDTNGDGIPAEACVIVKRLGSSQVMRGGFFGECGPETWATADARHIAGDSLEITFPILDLVEGGRLPPGSDYGYRVITQDNNGNEDTAPQDALAAHRDVPRVEARPGSADTLLGNQGTGSTAGGGRSQRTAVQAQEGAPIPGAETTGGDGFLGSVPIIGNLCSGNACFLIALGVPLAAAVLVRLGQTLYRARRRTGPTPLDDGDPPPGNVEPDRRSHPVHLWFAPPSPDVGTVHAVPEKGTGDGRQEMDHGSPL